MSLGSLIQTVELLWQAAAADLLRQGTVSSVAKAETAARRHVEESLFLALRGEPVESDLAEAVCRDRPPVDVLETVHQHLLSRKLEKGSDGTFSSRPSRSHRRRQGIYYTPDYIADYLAQRCLLPPQRAQRVRGRAGEGRVGIDVDVADWNVEAPPRILDPACGCGRFLRAAARQLQQQGRSATEIAASLHGCDLDAEAVVIARRMLQLVLAPNGTDPAAARAVAAALERNIAPGNALTTTSLPCDRGASSSSLPSEARGRVREGDNASRTSHRAGSKASRNGDANGDSNPPLPDPPPHSLRSLGTEEESSSSLQPPASSLTFDIILGNPPYRRELGTKALFDEIAATEFGHRYRAPRMDLWYYFLHRGIELLAPGGRLGFIVGAYWAGGAGAARLIRTLRETVHVDEVFGLDRLRVFPQVAGHHLMLVVSKPPSDEPTTVRIPLLDGGGDTDARPFVEGRAEVHSFTKSPDQLFRQDLLDLEPPAEALLGKLATLPTLGQLGRIRQGIAENPACVTKAVNARHGDPWRTGEGVFALSSEELESLQLPAGEQHLVRPYHDLCDLGRYDRIDDPSLHLIYSTRDTWPELEAFPVLAAHLARFRPIMEARRETRKGVRSWWHLHWPREARIWEQPKLIALQMAPRPSFVPAPQPTYTSFSTNVFLPGEGVGEHLNYFAALLNSQLLWKWFRHHAKRRGVGLEINGHVLARAPIRRIDFSSPEETRIHDRLVEFVDQMLDLASRQRGLTQPQVEAERRELDQRIDREVHGLYDLSDDDIATIEAAC